MKRVTITEIADAVGLSRNTVSKALSGNPSVALETKTLIIKKALSLGYPSYRITMPKEMEEEDIDYSKRNNFLIITKRETSKFWNDLILGISDVINERNDNMQLYVVSPEDENDEYIPSELFDNVSGLFVLSVFKKSFLQRIMRYELPVVFFDSPTNSDEYLKYGDCIMPEGFNSVRKMVESLIKQGLKRFSFLGDTTYCNSILQRYLGYCAAINNRGLIIDADMQFTGPAPGKYYDPEEVESAIAKCTYTPDAIICANDDIAVMAYKVLKDRGLDIPKDIAITGFDNTDTAEYISPSLTTAVVHTTEMGRRLAIQLYNRMCEPGMPKELIHICSEVIERDSSKRRKLF